MTILFAFKRFVIVEKSRNEIKTIIHYHPLVQTVKKIINYHVEFERVQTTRYLMIVDNSR